MNRVDGSFYVGGTLICAAMDIPAGTVVDADVASTAAIAASKLQSYPAKTYGQSGTAVAATAIVHVVRGATGTIKEFAVSNVTANAGASTVTVDLKKNGVSVLNSVVTLNNATGNRGVEEGIIDTTALVVDDVLEVVVALAQSGSDALAVGVAAELRLDEAYPL